MEDLKSAVRKASDEQWLNSINEMKTRGMSERQIADHLDISVSELRTTIAIVKNQIHENKKETL